MSGVCELVMLSAPSPDANETDVLAVTSDGVDCIPILPVVCDRHGLVVCHVCAIHVIPPFGAAGIVVDQGVSAAYLAHLCDFRPIFLQSVACRSLRVTSGRAKIRFAGMSPWLVRRR